MNNLCRIGAPWFSHSGTQLGNVKLVSRVAMGVVTGCVLLLAEGCSTADNTPHETSAEKAKQEATRLAKLQPLIDEQMTLGEAAASWDKWGEASKAVAKVLKMDPDHAGAQELKHRASWGPLPEKTSGNLKYKVHPISQACAITGVIDKKKMVASFVLPGKIEGRALIRIGCGAFSRCKGLTSLTIPSSVTSIGDGAFVVCWNLANLSVATGNPSYQADGGVLFTKGGKTLVLYPAGKPGESYIIPPSATRIGVGAFHGCYRLTSVTIPSSVTSIGDNAFYDCEGLTSVTIPSSVTSIGHKAFYDCKGLTSVTIPSSVTSLGYGPFAGCENLANFSVAAGNPSYQADGGVLFTKGGKTLVLYPAGKPGESYIIPPSATRIGVGAFHGCYRLTSVTIPSSVTSIGDNAFYDCEGLTSVTIPSSVTSIGDWAFCDCEGLTSVTIPSSVTSIGDGAFMVCWNLANLSVATGNPSYQADDGVLFTKGGKTLILYPKGKPGDTYTIPSSVTRIGDKAFYGCDGLASVTIPSGVTRIGDEAFLACFGLKSVTIPSSVTSIGDTAFYGCKSLKSVTLPKGVKLGKDVFRNCPWQPPK